MYIAILAFVLLAVCLVWFISVIIPHPALFEVIFRDTIWGIDSGTKRIALTFDDGPNPLYTLPILALLERHNAKGTFFLVGENVRKYPETAKAIKERGHDIGNHTYSHAILPFVSTRRIAEEILLADRVIEETLGEKPYLFRPPHGFRDPRVLREARRLGKSVIFWSIMPCDWANPGKEVIISSVLSSIKGGSVVVLHDNIETMDRRLSWMGVERYLFGAKDRKQTLEATESILSFLHREGYRMVTITELMADAQTLANYLEGTTRNRPPPGPLAGGGA